MSIAIALLVGVLVGGILVGISKTSVDDIPCQHWDYAFKVDKLAELETRVYILGKENERLNYIYQSMTAKERCFKEHFAAHCHYCGKNFYSKDMEGQEVADKLKSITLSAEEIAKKLDIKIM